MIQNINNNDLNKEIKKIKEKKVLSLLGNRNMSLRTSLYYSQLCHIYNFEFYNTHYVLSIKLSLNFIKQLHVLIYS
jgi:hypothetical protein